MARSKWKPKYVSFSLINSILKSKNRAVIFTKSRSSTILESFVGLVFAVYTGRKYIKVYVEQNMIGHKLGEFSFTRKAGKIHEKKTLNRNKKK